MGNLRVREAFLPVGHQVHVAKQNHFQISSLILPWLNDIPSLPHRLTWERLQGIIKTNPQRHARAFGSCTNKVVVLAQYRVLNPKEAAWPLQYLAEHIEMACRTTFCDYPPGAGFDLDAYLFAVEETSLAVRMEVFPRSIRGRAVTEYASAVSFFSPLMRYGEERETNVSLYILGSPNASWSEREQRAAEWNRHEGLWYLREPDAIATFMNDIAASITHDPKYTFGSLGEERFLLDVQSQLRGPRNPSKPTGAVRRWRK